MVIFPADAGYRLDEAFFFEVYLVASNKDTHWATPCFIGKSPILRTAYNGGCFGFTAFIVDFPRTLEANADSFFPLLPV